MKKAVHLSAFILLVILIFVSYVSSGVSAYSADSAPVVQSLATATVTSTPVPASLWRAPELPEMLVAESEGWRINRASEPLLATMRLELASESTEASIVSRTTWIYALVAPFPTVTDGVTLDELKTVWLGSNSGPFSGAPLWMTVPTFAAFTSLWGDPAPGVVKTAPADQLVDALWQNLPSWGIVPFEAIEPELKVLTVDGQSPIHKDFVAGSYPLKAEFALRSFGVHPAALSLALPDSNRDASRLTTVVMTGVTALVRATAYTMEVKGVLYPGQDIREIMREADIAHVSNEIPFMTGCDYPNPGRSKLVFCSDPRYIDLLTDIGTDVIELTGNHFGDYGAAAMLETLDIYEEKGLSYFGGGADLTDARQPAIFDVNGTRIAFVGCNPVDIGKFPVATDERPGANPCSYGQMTGLIEDLTASGYNVISTFQYHEYYSPEARPNQLEDFRRMADAGAVIVSGSQAHFAQVMEFYDGAFIHYGLGNLFFDQMGDVPAIRGIRREFMDRHVFYNGKYIGTELLTNMLEDYSRPRPMTPEERAAFLSEYFNYSGWTPLIETPTPPPTATLTPMTLPQPYSTLTPMP